MAIKAFEWLAFILPITHHHTDVLVFIFTFTSFPEPLPGTFFLLTALMDGWEDGWEDGCIR